MKYTIKKENVELTDSMKNYMLEKLSKMDKYFDNPDSIETKVVFIIRGREHKIEVTINGQDFKLRAEESKDDMYAAIDLVIDKLERQFRKYKTKLVSKKRIKEIEDEIEDYFEESSQTIVKRKKLFLKPMDEEEALVQMELLGHSFFIFKNVTDNKINVLYKRKDGDYGVIETE